MWMGDDWRLGGIEEHELLRESARERLRAQRKLHTHSLIYCSVMVVLWLIYVITGLRESVWFPWPLIAMGGWGVVVALHARQVYVRRVAGEEGVRRGTVRDETPPV